MGFPLTIDWASSSVEDDIIRYCADPACRLLDFHVALLNEDYVVKFGPNIHIEEFHNLQYLFEHVDRQQLVVPQPFHFFHDGHQGYLIMERIKGYSPITIEDVGDVAQALRQIHSLPGKHGDEPHIGPAKGGFVRGRFEEDIYFQDKNDIARFLDSKMVPSVGHIFDFSDQKLVFTHMDIAPRNVGRMPDGTLCIYDWAWSGFFPHWFEIAMLEGCSDTQPGSNAFKDRLARILRSTTSLTPKEEDMVHGLDQAMFLVIAKSFPPWRLTCVDYASLAYAESEADRRARANRSPARKAGDVPHRALEEEKVLTISKDNAILA